MYYWKITIDLGPAQTEVIAGFTEDMNSKGHGLLGQHGFFDRFSVSMHRSAALTVVEDWGAFDDRFGVQPREADQHRSRFET
jgi:hypothetical protein